MSPPTAPAFPPPNTVPTVVALLINIFVSFVIAAWLPPPYIVVNVPPFTVMFVSSLTASFPPP